MFAGIKVECALSVSFCTLWEKLAVDFWSLVYFPVVLQDFSFIRCQYSIVRKLLFCFAY